MHYKGKHPYTLKFDLVQDDTEKKKKKKSKPVLSYLVHVEIIVLVDDLSVVDYAAIACNVVNSHARQFKLENVPVQTTGRRLDGGLRYQNCP